MRLGSKSTSRLAILLAGVALSATSLNVYSASAQSSGPTNLLATDSLTDDGMAQVAQLMSSQPTDFAGGSVDEATHTITIHVADAGHAGLAMVSPRLRGAVAAVQKSQKPTTHNAQPWTVKYVSEKHSTADLQQIESQIPTREPFATAVKSSLSSFGLDPSVNKVRVGVISITPEIQAAAKATYGNDVVLEQTPRMEKQDRINDSAPYLGGDRITADNYVSCTAGIEYISSSYSVPQMLTAGHCFWDAYGEKWYQGTAPNSNKYMGFEGWWVAPNALSHGAYTCFTIAQCGDDVGLITNGSSNPPFGPQIWTNYGFASATATGANYVGKAVCSDGSVTGENCSGVISSVNTYLCDKTRNSDGACLEYTTHVDKVTSSNGSKMSQGGDSGSPVISGSLQIHGILDGGAGSWMYFTPIEYVQYLIGGGPVLG